MLRVVPIVKPAKPINPMITFLKIMNALAKPHVVFQRATQSKNAGNKMPNADRDKAPTNEINRSKFGIATAIITVKFKHQKFRCSVFVLFMFVMHNKIIIA